MGHFAPIFDAKRVARAHLGLLREVESAGILTGGPSARRGSEASSRRAFPSPGPPERPPERPSHPADLERWPPGGMFVAAPSPKSLPEGQLVPPSSGKTFRRGILPQ